MPGHFIRRMEAAELKNLFIRIEKDFPHGDYAPYDVLYRHIQNGTQEALIFSEGSRELAYAICAADHTSGYILISLLAVFEEARGVGIGSAFMKAMAELYAHKKAIIVEVEQPELAENPEDLETRKRRIRFYEKAGFHLISGIEYIIWGIPMHLMALPLSVPKEEINEDIGQIMYQLYLELSGKRYIHKMQIRASDRK